MKGIQTPGAAYETFPGMTAAEAAEKGYVVVETSADGTSPIYGRYLDTATGAALETLADKDDRVAIPAGGESVAKLVAGDKGALLNPDDPIVHGQADKNPHEDGAPALPSDNKGLADTLEGYVPGETHRKPGRPRKAD